MTTSKTIYKANTSISPTQTFRKEALKRLHECPTSEILTVLDSFKKDWDLLNV